jgi:hypothetical protein
LSQIFNKSSHPVAIKRIPIRMWSLRAEIEAALEHRIKECEAAGIPLYIDDIKEFYGMNVSQPLKGQPQLRLVDTPAVESTVPLDNSNVDDLMASLAAENENPAEAKPALEEKLSETQPPASEQADQIIASQTPQEKVEAASNPFQKPFQRITPNTDKISYGFSFLADINMDWVLAFSKDSFLQGSCMVIEFLIPNPFTMNVEVSLCHKVTTKSRIISATKPDYRLQCRFSYSQPGERSNLRKFLSSIEPDIPGLKPLATSTGQAGSQEDSGA